MTRKYKKSLFSKNNFNSITHKVFAATLLVIPSFFIPPYTMAEAQAPWSYDDDYTGQVEWGAIKGYEICETGSNQSPVIISYTKTADMPPLDYSYTNTKGILGITHNSFAVHVLGDTSVKQEGKPYKLETIEFHSPSGHWIKEKFYSLEIHLVHKNEDGEMLIIAIFANIGDENPSLKTITDQIQINTSRTEFFPFDMNSLLPVRQGYYAYDGSLPYPPCTEGVKWRIMKTPITVSREQLVKITRLVGRNTRLPQPVYIREIMETPN